MATVQFDATNVDPTSTFTPLPAGEYQVIITESENKQTKNGDGQYLSLKMEIQGGEFSGRILFDRLNLWNSNKTAQDIAQRTLSQICHSVGHLRVNDSSELHFKPLIAIVKVRPANAQYDAQNEIKGYKQAAAMPQGAPFKPPQAAAANGPVNPAGGFGNAGMPWMNKAA